MFESQISSGATENCQGGSNLCVLTSGKDMLKKCFERLRIGEQKDSSFSVSSLWLDDHHFNEEELETFGAF